MDLHRLEVFCKVIELKSFTKAAEAVFLSQPTVSEHIRTLEEGVGQRLVDRLGREVLPTQAGQLLYKYAQKLLRLRQEAIQALESHSGAVVGHLYAGASTIPGTYILPRLIGALKEQAPGITITLFIGNSRKVADGVLAGDTEFGVVGARWSDPGLEWQELFDDELVLAVPPDHPLAGQEAIAPHQLAGIPFVVRERDSGTRRVMTQLLEQHLDLGRLTVAAEMGSTEAVRQAIKARVGAGILSSRAVEEDLASGSLVAVPIAGVQLRRPFYLVRRRNRNPSPICAQFLDFMEQWAATTRDGQRRKKHDRT
ncbi:MAG: selenium metabolism-associated LysR family transcriptional regulator [Thermodesulfobacteriota bacterium]